MGRNTQAGVFVRDKFCGLIGFDAGGGIAQRRTAAQGANGIAGPRQEGEGQGFAQCQSSYATCANWQNCRPP